MYHGINKRIAKLKEARKIIERQEYANVNVPSGGTVIEIDTGPVLEAIDREIVFLELIVGGNFHV